MTLKEFYTRPAIMSFFPLKFPDGVRQWSRFEAGCRLCGKPIDERNVRGEVLHPFPEVFVLRALGYCETCRILLPIEYNFTGDMAMIGRDADGDWCRWDAKRTWRGRLRKQQRQIERIARLITG